MKPEAQRIAIAEAWDKIAAEVASRIVKRLWGHDWEPADSRSYREQAEEWTSSEIQSAIEKATDDCLPLCKSMRESRAAHASELLPGVKYCSLCRKPASECKCEAHASEQGYAPNHCETHGIPYFNVCPDCADEIRVQPAHASDPLNLNEIRDNALNMIACGINHSLSPDDEEYVKGKIDWVIKQVMWSRLREPARASEQGADTKRTPSDNIATLYMQLILAVQNKYEGETRHQTALRLIRQAQQSQSSDAAMSQTK